MHVIVIGAGLGGLCLAQRLRRLGISVSVHERDTTPAFRHQGYRLHINADGRRALEHALPPQLWQLFLGTAGTPGPRSVFLDEQLLPRWTAEADSGPAPLAADRLTLRQILLAGLEDVVTFGKTCTGFESTPTDDTPTNHANTITNRTTTATTAIATSHTVMAPSHISANGRGSATNEPIVATANSRITAHFADGSTVTGDVLVAADGVNSVIRRQLLPHARVIDTGLRQLYGKIPLTAQTRTLFSDDMFNVFTAIVGPGSAFVGVAPVEFPEPMDQAIARHAPDVLLRDVRDYMTVSFGTRREHLPRTDDELHQMTGTELRAMVLDLIDGWHPRVQRIVQEWDPASIFPAILRTSVPIEPWPTSAVTLIGDAIHAMSPAGGVGANTALRDAATLADALNEAAHGRPLVAALRAYEAAMIGYGFAAVRASADNGHRFLGQNPLPTV
ncbi:FAD-dependent oxidoreductase [Nonomuraea aurantiaca]|uniref:FAD-dependent oxidoreductase n=1 Tax=Nonomuraea aurantiaca TaxID=2878562 RepID=UPI001CDA0B00|nr:NAD(P)/FAD-dependent oxidoreductase [Nonomuraea aurantiaca]MCA2223692.1 FAD-dependent monooxygenase [Nonomuraea aurantiaca]